MPKYNAFESSEEMLKLGYLQSEKCELLEARRCFERALELAKTEKNRFNMGEALVGLLRLAGEALDEKAIDHWDREIERLAKKDPEQVTSKVWYCRGVVAMFRERWTQAQRHFHIYLRLIRKFEERDLAGEARVLCMLSNCLQQRGHWFRAETVVNIVLRDYEKLKIRGINGIAYLIRGNIAERRKQYKVAHAWFKRAHASFLGEHNWYFHLYVLYGYARLARLEQDYKRSEFYISLIEKAASGEEFGVLRREMALERSRLESDVVDLLIDSRRGIVKTRDGGPISFRKQYVLLDILRALSNAHSEEGGVGTSPGSGGLSKSQIIERVWRERYRSEAHDNKLYYNINRLRKLIEPDARKPQYLLNWKEGYRLAPGLRVQFVDLDLKADRSKRSLSPFSMVDVRGA